MVMTADSSKCVGVIDVAAVVHVLGTTFSPFDVEYWLETVTNAVRGCAGVTMNAVTVLRRSAVTMISTDSKFILVVGAVLNNEG